MEINVERFKLNKFPKEYVYIPITYQGYKIEFRIYLLVVSTKKPIIYFYSTTLLKQCILPFDPYDTRKSAHVCNTELTDDEIFEVEGASTKSEYLKDWNLEEMTEALIEMGLVKEKKWLNKYLIPLISKKLAHLYRIGDIPVNHDSRFGELFAIDFLLDTDLKLWILECNPNPNFLAVSERRQELFENLAKNTIDLMIEYIQLKFKRIKRLAKDVKYMSLVERHEYLYQQLSVDLEDDDKSILKDTKGFIRINSSIIPENCQV